MIILLVNKEIKEEQNIHIMHFIYANVSNNCYKSVVIKMEQYNRAIFRYFFDIITHIDTLQ